jgi:Ca2+-binding RTX toxin-like protein
MATELGGIKIGDNAKASAEHAISDFFKGFDFTSATDFGSTKGKHVFQDDAGNKIAVFESGKKAKLTAGETSVIDGSGKKVIGSKGDDKVLVEDDAGHKLTSGKGNDTVVLNGNGSNKVDGGKGDDTIVVEGSGNNNIKGGQGSDTFVFGEEATGNNVIKDFKEGDILKIMDRTDDGKVVEGQDFTMAQDGKNTVINLTDGGTITLKKVDVNDLKDGDTTPDDGIFQL